MPQAREGGARRRLREVQLPRGRGHVAVLEQRVQRPKQVEIKGSDIHQIDTAYLKYRFDSRLGTMYRAMGQALEPI
jgi:hypothetical protein